MPARKEKERQKACALRVVDVMLPHYAYRGSHNSYRGDPRGAHETAQNDVIGRRVGQGSARTTWAVDDTFGFLSRNPRLPPAPGVLPVAQAETRVRRLIGQVEPGSSLGLALGRFFRK